MHQTPRGTYDLLFEDTKKHSFILEQARNTAETYGFSEVLTPIFEHQEVFQKSLGLDSDIISKEMYVFEDRGGEKFVLRPEGTAGVVRAFINADLGRSLPVKLFYSGPMFRYERPQKGRFRQFYQMGAEFLGLDSFAADVEVILLAQQMLSQLGVSNKVQLEINSIGDTESRQAYRKELIKFLMGVKQQLSPESQKRLEQNPLRILDSKQEEDQVFIEQAPHLEDFLNQKSKDRFAEILEALDQQGVKYIINERLVRGLDYYHHCVFEFTSNELGAQSAVLAGGRYDHLVQQMGGPAVSGVGWACGIERLRLLVADTYVPQRSSLAVIVLDQEKQALEIAEVLRSKGYPTDIIYSGNLSKRLKKAKKVGATHAFIVAEDEMSTGQVTLKDLETQTQQTGTLEDLVQSLQS